MTVETLRAYFFEAQTLDPTSTFVADLGPDTVSRAVGYLTARVGTIITIITHLACPTVAVSTAGSINIDTPVIAGIAYTSIVFTMRVAGTFHAVARIVAYPLSGT